MSKPLRNPSNATTAEGANEPLEDVDQDSQGNRVAWLGIGVVLLASAVLALVRLNSTSFWDDEAQVGIIARNFLHSGTLTGWDGRNLYGYRDGALLDSHLRYINPPLDCLVAAASFKLFGISTWAGRFPFVLIGLASLLVFLAMLRRDFPNKPSLHAFALAAWALSPNFLLNIRNCRYYALSLAASLCMYYCYRRFVSESDGPPETPERAESGSVRWAAAVGFAVSSIAAFYASYLLFAAFLLALCVLHLALSPRAIGRRELPMVLVSAVILLAATAPYAVQHRIWIRQDIVVHDELIHRATLIWWNLRDLNVMAAMPWMVGIVLAVVLVRGLQSKDIVARAALSWVVLSVAYVVFLALLSIQPTTTPTIADLRYLIPAAPFLAGLSGIAFWSICRRARLVGFVPLGVLVCTNAFTLLPPQCNTAFPLTGQWRWLLPGYIGEVSHPYPTSEQAVETYLRANAQQDDVVYCNPNYMDGPLLFSMGDRVIIGCQLDHSSHLPPALTSSLNPQLFIGETYPQWLIFYSTAYNSRNIFAYFSRPHLVNGYAVRYRYSLVQSLNVYFEQTQRPELPQHHFGPLTSFDHNGLGVYVLHNEGLEPVETPQQ